MVPRLGMVLPELLARAKAVAVEEAGDQVEVFIAAVGLGRITVLTELLPVPLRWTQTAVPLPAIGLMPSQTHCYACAMGLHQHRALFHLPPKLLAIMVGLDAEVAGCGNQVHIPEATVV